ncbi:hypothetical protein [Bacillus xiapuensis]|uniref:WYL domain-containing protein n=1 Tax=Bacillus xiapuensis TaxID=2014075 RepID=A0ABU6N9X9_9BACI|nr:hypothetical protein [Bacillus xiapuensis]
MNQYEYEITEMIIDDDFTSEEYVTVEFSYDQKEYCITYKKSDLELINSWVFENGTSLPAKLTEEMIESIREDVREKIQN